MKYHLYFEGDENEKLFTDYLGLHKLAHKYRLVCHVYDGHEKNCYDYILDLSDDDLMFIKMVCNITKVVKMW